MRIPRTEVIDLGEYTILIEYDGQGGLDVTVRDELGGDIEAIYISDIPEGDDLGFDINLN
jgi:hypothetical protein